MFFSALGPINYVADPVRVCVHLERERERLSLILNLSTSHQSSENVCVLLFVIHRY